MKFNINQLISVQLNDKGRAILNSSLYKLNVMKNDDGTHRMPLWIAMKIFGFHMVMGEETPFVNNEIIFEREKDK